MIVFILFFLIIMLGGLIYFNKDVFKNMNNIFRILVLVNFIICIYLYIIKDVKNLYNTGMVIFILLNVFAFGLSNLITKRNILIGILVLYFVMIWFTPLYTKTVNSKLIQVDPDYAINHKSRSYNKYQEYYNPYNHFLYDREIKQ